MIRSGWKSPICASRIFSAWASSFGLRPTLRARGLKLPCRAHHLDHRFRARPGAVQGGLLPKGDGSLRVMMRLIGQGKYIGICGQGPSDHPELAQWLVEQKIESISLNPDTVVAQIQGGMILTPVIPLTTNRSRWFKAQARTRTRTWSARIGGTPVTARSRR